MQCPYCGKDSRVVDSRSSPDAVRRRRICNECRRRFTTYERVGSPSIKVLKRSGRTEPFDSQKLMRTLRRVCRDRPALGARDVERVARAIEAELDDSGARTIRSGQIVDLLLSRLAEIDRLAHSRLAADYLDESGRLRTESPPMSAEEAGQLGLFHPEEES